MSTYSEKLKDPRWQKMRLKVLDRDEFKCQLCNSDENTLHVHHKYYAKGHEPWQYDLQDLITLCEACHEKLKGKIDKSKPDVIIQTCIGKELEDYYLCPYSSKIRIIESDGEGYILRGCISREECFDMKRREFYAKN